jgi:hypothetical protein
MLSERAAEGWLARNYSERKIKAVMVLAAWRNVFARIEIE